MTFKPLNLNQIKSHIKKKFSLLKFSLGSTSLREEKHEVHVQFSQCFSQSSAFIAPSFSNQWKVFSIHWFGCADFVLGISTTYFESIFQ